MKTLFGLQLDFQEPSSVEPGMAPSLPPPRHLRRNKVSGFHPCVDLSPVFYSISASLTAFSSLEGHLLHPRNILRRHNTPRHPHSTHRHTRHPHLHR